MVAMPMSVTFMRMIAMFPFYFPPKVPFIFSGRFDSAITDMKKAIEIQPDFKPAQECLAQANVDKLAKISKDNESWCNDVLEE